MKIILNLIYFLSFLTLLIGCEVNEPEYVVDYVPPTVPTGINVLIGDNRIDLYWNVIFTTIFAISLFIAVQWGIFWVAVAVLASHALAMPMFTVWATRYVFAPKRFSVSK